MGALNSPDSSWLKKNTLLGTLRLKWCSGVNDLSSSIHFIIIGVGDPEWKHLLPRSQGSQEILPQMETTDKKIFARGIKATAVGVKEVI